MLKVMSNAGGGEEGRGFDNRVHGKLHRKATQDSLLYFTTK